MARWTAIVLAQVTSNDTVTLTNRAGSPVAQRETGFPGLASISQAWVIAPIHSADRFISWLAEDRAVIVQDRETSVRMQRGLDGAFVGSHGVAAALQGVWR